MKWAKNGQTSAISTVTHLGSPSTLLLLLPFSSNVVDLLIFPNKMIATGVCGNFIQDIHPVFLCLGIYRRTLASVDTMDMYCLLDANPDKKGQILGYSVVVPWHMKVYFSFSKSKESAQIQIIGLVQQKYTCEISIATVLEQ